MTYIKLGDLVRLAKARPGAINYASAGTGSSTLSYIPVGDEPAEFGAYIKSEVDKLAKLVTKLNLTAETIK